LSSQQSALVDADILVYIRDQIVTDTKLKKWSDSVQNEITTALMKKAGGMYGRLSPPRDALGTASSRSLTVFQEFRMSPYCL
jgi:hypothetical protein